MQHKRRNFKFNRSSDIPSSPIIEGNWFTNSEKIVNLRPNKRISIYVATRRRKSIFFRLFRNFLATRKSIVMIIFSSHQEWRVFKISRLANWHIRLLLFFLSEYCNCYSLLTSPFRFLKQNRDACCLDWSNCLLTPLQWTCQWDKAHKVESKTDWFNMFLL